VAEHLEVHDLAPHPRLPSLDLREIVDCCGVREAAWNLAFPRPHDPVAVLDQRIGDDRRAVAAEAHAPDTTNATDPSDATDTADATDATDAADATHAANTSNATDSAFLALAHRGSLMWSLRFLSLAMLLR
jgi:hypothetical protein